ncbi:MAG: sporulation protein, partial [Firmicutes bacterium]|nr:sporulation protein [Bacillota bacterium]
DMVTANYFGHNSPNFGSTFNLVRQWGIPYTYGGENLAGAANVATAHRMLMNSSGHRANILNPRFNRIGIGIVHGGPYGAFFTQIFLG